MPSSAIQSGHVIDSYARKSESGRLNKTIHFQKNQENFIKNFDEPKDFCPLIAATWVDLIVEHLKDSIKHGELDIESPIDVLDLVPGCGQTVWMMAQGLFQEAKKIAGLRIRYIPVICDRSWLTSVRKIADFQEQLISEAIVPLLWESMSNEPCLLLPSGRKLWVPVNPAIVIAHDRWASFHQRLFAIHYGKLLEANLQLFEKNIATENKKFEWSEPSNMEWANNFLPLIEHYIRQLNSSPIPFPDGALLFFERIGKLANRGYFLISSTAGFSSERQLRLCSFSAVTDALIAENGIPVNFHFLAHRLQQLGAESQEIELQKGIVVQLVLSGHMSSHDRLAALRRKIDVGLFQHAPALAETMQLLGRNDALDSRLALLRLSKYDPVVFLAGYGSLIQGFAAAKKGFDKFNWRLGLQHVWENAKPFLKIKALHGAIATAAMHCGHWGLARQSLLQGMQSFGKTAIDLANLAWCEARTGRLSKAKSLVSEALVLEENCALAVQVKQRIEDRLIHWDSKWAIEIHHTTLPISIEPLDESHAEAFFYQYRDPQIGVMTGLPALNTIEEVREWINSQNAELERANFAIMHSDHGFVGYINFAMSAHASYFCFWTGVDFQGNGWASAASRLAFHFMNKNGISVLLTSAYSDNARSIRALKCIGFVELEIRAVPPDHDRIFFSMLSASAEVTDGATELINYYSREKLPLHFLGQPPIVTGSEGDQTLNNISPI